MLNRRMWQSHWKGFFQPWEQIDWILLLSMLSLTGIGGLLIRSTQLHKLGIGVSVSWWSHWVTALVGLVLTMALAQFRYERLERWMWIVYGITNGSLIAVKFIGTSELGAQSWINIGGFYVQPSEMAKVGVIVVLAAFLSNNEASKLPNLLKALAIFTLPWVLVFIQPDLGSSLVFIAVVLAMLYWANAKGEWILLLVSPLVSAILFGLGTTNKFAFALWCGWCGLTGFWGLTSFPFRSIVTRIVSGVVALGLNIGFGFSGTWAWTNVLKAHQRVRLTSFLDPQSDPLGSGYHLIQSAIAVGSGGMFGQGLNQGTQTQLEFIPEQHTDFIFSAVGEELGFVGSMMVIGLFWLVCLRLVIIAQNAKDNFGSLLAVGVLAMILIQALINIGMTIGVSPVTGIPLPWLSYGRFALLTNFVAIGLVESVANYRRRKARF